MSLSRTDQTSDVELPLDLHLIEPCLLEEYDPQYELLHRERADLRGQAATKPLECCTLGARHGKTGQDYRKGGKDLNR